ncbi:MAG: hypothetical protein HN341_17075 [Verrucomicrobia bacterium]|nr:hypothetical protein [Verrucomicrobiota bacterium]
MNRIKVSGFWMLLVLLMVCTMMVMASVSAHAESVVYVDFDNTAGAITAGETYNTLTTTSGSGSPIVGAGGQDFLNLVDTNGSPTDVDLNVQATNAAFAAGGGASVRDSIAGIDDNALDDGFWVNNGNNHPGTVNLVLTFSSLGTTAYNIQLTANFGLEAETVWQITTGIGDASTFTVNEANDESGLGSWGPVTPVGGEIVLTGTFDSNETWDTTTLSFVSLTPVPLPINANGVSYTDKSAAANTISLPDMQAVLNATDDLDYAAVFDNEISSANTSFSKDPNYPGTKAFTISGAKAHTGGGTDLSQGGYGGISHASVIPTPSGTKHGWIGATPNSMTWRFGPPAGGRITHVGFMWKDWNTWDTDVTVKAHFSGGSTVTQTAANGGWFWFGYAAPNGESVTKLIVTKTNVGGNYGAFDDIVVVAEAAPENVTVTDVAITNHDFETGTTGWGVVNGGAGAPAWGLLEGSKSAQISPPAAGVYASVYQTTGHTISSRETFTLTYLAGKSNWNRADNVGIIYYLDGANREPITTLNFGASPPVVSVHGYAVSRVTALASDVPAAAYGKKLGIELAGRNSNANAWLTVDDVTLEVSYTPPVGTIFRFR